MRYLLDTCVLSEIVKTAPEPAVVRWLQGRDESRLFLSVLVLGEIQKGIEKLAPSKRKRRLESWLQADLRQRFEGRIWEVSEAVALSWGSLQGRAEKAGRALPVIDGLLAATATTHQAVLVTRNVADVAASGVETLDPWPH